MYEPRPIWRHVRDMETRTADMIMVMSAEYYDLYVVEWIISTQRIVAYICGTRTSACLMQT